MSPRNRTAVACRNKAALAAKSSDIILSDLGKKEEKNPGGEFYWGVI
jgi:hypothetical protein